MWIKFILLLQNLTFIVRILLPWYPWSIATESESVSLSLVWLCDPIDCSPPGSSVHRILQARILEWAAISFSRGSSKPRDWTWVPALLAGFYHLSYQLRAWQQSTSNWGDLKWVNNGCWLNIQGSGTLETTARLFLAPWQISFYMMGLSLSWLQDWCLHNERKL